MRKDHRESKDERRGVQLEKKRRSDEKDLIGARIS